MGIYKNVKLKIKLHIHRFSDIFFNQIRNLQSFILSRNIICDTLSSGHKYIYFFSFKSLKLVNKILFHRLILCRCKYLKKATVIKVTVIKGHHQRSLPSLHCHS